MRSCGEARGGGESALRGVERGAWLCRSANGVQRAEGPGGAKDFEAAERAQYPEHFGQVQADSDALAQTEGAVAALLARAAEAQRQAAESQQRARTASEAASGARKASRAKREEKLKAEGALRTNVAERELLAAQLAEAEAAVREAGAERKEARREQKMREAVAALKRLYPN
ncbi:hypothetical protein HaLaN_32718, partial [Haematococcus lacustris]